MNKLKVIMLNVVMLKVQGSKFECYNVESYKVRTLGIPDEKGARLARREVEEGSKC